MISIGNIFLSLSTSQTKKSYVITAHTDNKKITLSTGRYDKDGHITGLDNDADVIENFKMTAYYAKKFQYIVLPDSTVDTYNILLVHTGKVFSFPAYSAQPILIGGVPHLESFDQVVERLLNVAGTPFLNRPSPIPSKKITR